MRIGIDIGGMSIKLGLVDEEGKVIAKKVIETGSDRYTPEEIISHIGQAVLELLQENDVSVEVCEQIGIACPGTCDPHTGTVLYSNNIRWENVPLLDGLDRYLDVPMALANDADAAALAEVLFGVARGRKNAILLTLGTGVGGGVIVDRKIFMGPLRGGCEPGHMVIVSGGKRCTCGRRGCLESYASASALMEIARAAAQAHPESLLAQWSEGDLSRIDGKMIFTAEKSGDETAAAVIAEYEDYLSAGIANLINIFRPEAVILGGGVSAQKEYLTDAVQERVDRLCFGGAHGEIARIVTSELGNDAGMIGAAFLEPQPKKESEIIFLKPKCTANIWGGTRLRDEYGYEVPDERTGECWGISAHPNAEGIVADGRFAGMRLTELWEKHPKLFGHMTGGKFPLLTKIIDAQADLSIQVHPDDTYALRNENGSFGKTECWYILDCPEDAKIVLGHHAKTRQEMESMIRDGRWKDFIREVPVKKGDLVQIDPGTVHAIKGGMLILETQQNSDITYRLYDYDRLSNGKPRELHLDKSMDVIRVPAADPGACVFSTDGLEKNNLHLIYTCNYYHIFKMELEGSAEFMQEYPFLLVTICEGEGTINGCAVRKGMHMILPAGFGNVNLEGNLLLIASTV